MLEQVPNPQVVRFGTFEVDLRLGELRKNGIRVKLTGQPFQILVILLEHPGDLVTRRAVGGGGGAPQKVVDSLRGLNAAINRRGQLWGAPRKSTRGNSPPAGWAAFPRPASSPPPATKRHPAKKNHRPPQKDKNGRGSARKLV